MRKVNQCPIRMKTARLSIRERRKGAFQRELKKRHYYHGFNAAYGAHKLRPCFNCSCYVLVKSRDFWYHKRYPHVEINFASYAKFSPRSETQRRER